MEDKILEPDDFFLSVNGEEPSPENPYIFASNSKKLFIKNERCKNSEKMESTDKSIIVWKEFSAEAHETCHNEAYDFIFGHLYTGSEDYYSDDKFDASDYEDTRYSNTYKRSFNFAIQAKTKFKYHRVNHPRLS